MYRNEDSDDQKMMILPLKEWWFCVAGASEHVYAEVVLRDHDPDEIDPDEIDPDEIDPDALWTAPPMVSFVSTMTNFL